MKMMFLLLFLSFFFLSAPSEERLLVDPEEAPPAIKKQVMEGYKIVTETSQYAKEWTVNHLNCRSCHFKGGNTWGGKNGSVSLLGVTKVYPRFMARDGKNIDLAERIQSCFLRSLNGKAPPKDSPAIQSIIAYLEWITKVVEDDKDFPWLGLKPLTVKVTPNASRGKEVYVMHCGACHGSHGQGTVEVKEEKALDLPPLWGKESFNDAAGMNQLEKLSSFIFYNMPYQNPLLSEEDAVHVAEYIIQQPRPHFEP